MTIEVEIADSQSVLVVDKEVLRGVVEQTLRAEQVAGASISVALVDNPTLRELNRRHLGHDYDTDVLSFLLECETVEPLGEIPEGATRGFGQRLEGEVILSTEMAAQTAESFGWRPQDEVVLYLVHGLLHLVGYDDLSDDEQQVMRERERGILKFWNLTPHYEEAGGASDGPNRPRSRSRESGADP